MAFGASLVTGGADIDAPAMLGVACGALRHLRLHLVLVMDWAVMAGEAGAVGGGGKKLAGLLHVASGALLFQHGVRLAHPAAGVDARIVEKAAPGDPDERHWRHQNAEPQLGALVGRPPFEIIQVDALRQLLGCACSRHSSLATSSNIAAPQP